MGKKKFLDKKKSATFHLLSRDSAADADADADGPQPGGGDRVFVRVDNNPFCLDNFGDQEQQQLVDEDPDSIFADADEDDAADVKKPISSSHHNLPDNIRREILELGLPDDGYNYLLHMREIKNTGGGSSYFQNPKAPKPSQQHTSNQEDVRAYDASRVRLPAAPMDEWNDNSIYTVAEKTIDVRLHKAVDPEVAALLDYDDTDSSLFCSDVEVLEEDFVVQANQPQEEEVEQEDDDFMLNHHNPITHDKGLPRGSTSRQLNGQIEYVDDNPRVRRPLDEQFDMLTLQEYGTESESDHEGSLAAEDECLVDKLTHMLENHVEDDLEFDDKYRVPADLLHDNEGSNNEAMKSAAEVIRRCAEYAEMYDNRSEDDEVVILEESSDEDEAWDCETIVSTYSNLDNHPGKIGAPGVARKKKLSETISAVSGADNHVISLRGRKKLPVDYLTPRAKPVLEKISEIPGSILNQQKRRPQGGESKEEKKERKAAVKEERREARKAKKELKGIYRCEAQRAQKVVAVSGPSAIHLM